MDKFKKLKKTVLAKLFRKEESKIKKEDEEISEYQVEQSAENLQKKEEVKAKAEGKERQRLKAEEEAEVEAKAKAEEYAKG